MFKFNILRVIMIVYHMEVAYFFIFRLDNVPSKTYIQYRLSVPPRSTSSSTVETLGMGGKLMLRRMVDDRSHRQ